MATKTDTMAAAAMGEGCLGKAAPGEPVFVLRGQDALAAILVDEWASRARAAGTPEEKWREAMAVADAMWKWPRRKVPD